MILIVDDDPDIRRLLASYLIKSGYEVMEAGNAVEARTIVSRIQPELILLDLGLPDQDGLSLAREWSGKEGLAPFPIIMISARVSDHERILGLEIGADDYITKPFIPNEVIARIQALLRRTKRYGQSEGDMETGDVIHNQGFCLDRRSRKFKLTGSDIPLTPTEMLLIEILMKHPGWVFSREELLTNALGYNYEGMGRTLDTHIRNIRKKIAVVSKDFCPLETVYGIGYRWSVNN